MRLKDILKQCFFNMWRRKTRTTLAILGVFIGVFSILVTVSIGLAITYTLDQSMNDIEGIKIITIYGVNEDRRGRNSEVGGRRKRAMDDRLIAELKQMSHVAAVSPSFNLNGAILFHGKPVYSNMRALNPEMLQYMGYHLDESEMISKEDTNHVYVRGSVLTEALGREIVIDEEGRRIDPKLSEEEIKSFTQDTLVHTFNYEKLNNGWGARGPAFAFPENESQKPKLTYPETKLKIKKIFPRYGYNTESYITFKAAIKIFDEFLKKNALNSEEANSQVHEYVNYKKNKLYGSILVGVADIEKVQGVLHQLKEMGIEATNPIEFFEEIRKVFVWIQLVLGGLGAISLLVATIGITNTTIMTIYERTKEIGIMKVIGANLKDIRNLFLFESGMIGFSGGLVGSIVAWLLSKLANFIFRDAGILNFASVSDGGSKVVSYIPLWLILATLLVSTGVGLLAGYFPSRRAMRMSALESLRAE